MLIGRVWQTVTLKRRDMKWLDLFVRRGVDPLSYGVYGKGAQRRMVGKAAVSFLHFSVTDCPHHAR